MVVVKKAFTYQEQYGTAGQVSKLVGVSARTVENWARNGKISRKDGEGYGLICSLIYASAQLREKLEAAQSGGSKFSNLQERKLLAECQKIEAQAKREQLAAEREEGDLVSASEVQRAWENIIFAVRAKLLALPGRFAQQLADESDPDRIELLLTGGIHESLTELEGDADGESDGHFE